MTEAQERGPPPGSEGPGRPLAGAIATTIVVTFLSYALPPEHAASAVGLCFLGATYWLALGKDPDAARRHGLSLGGLLDPEPLDAARLGKSALRELGVALLFALVVFPPFWAGYVAWWSPERPFTPASPASLADDALGQFLVIALPEEAFYRGYLQSRLDEVWKPKLRLLGATVGPALLVTSALFAAGHLATEMHPNRLAVFFPSLLFGWIRARQGGVGCSAAFHAMCNLFASYLARSYGLAG